MTSLSSPDVMPFLDNKKRKIIKKEDGAHYFSTRHFTFTPFTFLFKKVELTQRVDHFVYYSIEVLFIKEV